MTDDATMLALIKQIHESQLQLDIRLTKHMTEETTELASAIVRLMTDAFANGDTVGHRKAHEAWIEHTKEKADFYRKMRLELSKWGLLGFLAWAGYALWSAFLLGPHK